MRMKRILSMLLCVVMVVCLLPNVAFAAGEESTDFSLTVVNNGDNTFTITRHETTNADRQIHIRTVDGSAVAGTHYTAVENTFTFSAAGESYSGMTANIYYEVGESTITVSVPETNASNIDFINKVVASGYDKHCYFLEVWDNYNSSQKIKRVLDYGDAYTIDINQSITPLTDDYGTVTDGGWSNNVNIYGGMPTFTDEAMKYFSEHQAMLLCKVSFDAYEVDDGYQYIQINASPTTYTGYTNTNTSDGDPGEPVSTENYTALFASGFQHGSSLDTSTASYEFPFTSDPLLSNDTHIVDAWKYLGNSVGINEKAYYPGKLNKVGGLLSTNHDNSMIIPWDTQYLSVRFNASGSNSDTWKFSKLRFNYTLMDSPSHINSTELHLPAVGSYNIGDTITIPLVFDTPVAAYESYIKTAWGIFSYAGGAGTNTLYFTGTISNQCEGETSCYYIPDSSYFSTLFKHVCGLPISYYFNTANSLSKGIGPAANTQYTIFVSADQTAGGTVTGGRKYGINESVTVSATANSGYQFVRWTEGGNEVSTSERYTFTVNANRHLVAVFEAVAGTVAAPTFSPSGGTYTVPQTVTLSCTTAGATIRYTTDGTAPTSASTEYTAPITVSATTTIKAKAFLTGWANSAVSKATYTIIDTVAAPTFSPAGGTYAEPQRVTISCTTADATIRYTTDGTDPTSASAQYYVPITVSTTQTIKAKAFLTGWADSAVSSAEYTILCIPAAPTNLTATPGDSQITLSWTTPISDGGSPITKYQVSFVEYAGPDSWQDIPSSGATTTGYVISNLLNGMSYTIKVRAVNAIGEGASASTTATPVSPRIPITNVTLSSTYGPSVGDILSAVITPAEATVTYIWTVDGVAEATTETYTVKAADLGKKIILTVTGIGNYEGETRAVGSAPVNNNCITGITADQIFTLGDTVTFTANGDGMDNTDIQIGNRRWLPTEWQTNPSGNFDSGLTQSFSTAGMMLGAHTLTVTFVYQSYSGEKWGWIDNGVTCRKSVNFTLEADTPPVTSYTVSVSADPSAGGTVTGGGSYNENDSVTVAATANSGYHFVNWTESGTEVSTSASYTFSATADRTLVAVFEADTPTPPPATTYTIAVSADPSAGGTVTGGGTYNENVSVTVAATANSGYHFVKWTEGGTQVSTSASYTFSVTADRTLVAMFEADTPTPPTTYTVTVNGSYASTTGAGSYASGETVYIYAGTRNNYSFDGWTSNDIAVIDASSRNANFTMPDKNVTVTANWSYNGGGGSSYTYYTITATAGEGGSISPSGNVSVREGLDKAFTIAPKDGYVIDDVTVDGVSVKKQIVSYTYTFENVQKSHTIKATFIEESKVNPDTGVDNPFTDVKDTDWFFKDVMFVYDRGLMIGTSDTTFSPYSTTTRAMVATTIWRMEGKPTPSSSNPFDDVESGKYYTDAVTWAKENSIVAGYSATSFGPNDPVTREQLAMFFYNYAKYKGYDTGITGSLDRFTDKGDVSDWAQDAMQWAVGYGLIQGKTDNTLDPKGNATRAEFAAMLHRFIEKNELVEGVTTTGLMGWIDPKRLGIPNTGDTASSAWPFVMFTSLAACAVLILQNKRREDAQGGMAEA